MSCCAPPPLPAVNMLTLSQVSLLVAKAPQDDNNNFGCGVLALKMMSSRYALSARAQPRSAAAPSATGPKRCLFGAPSACDTQRLLREDQEAVKARMMRRWGWDPSQEAPSASSSPWKWEHVKPRRHPYAVRPSSPKAVTPAPAIVSPLPSTPTATLNTSAASSSSGTSTLSPTSPTSPCPAALSVELCESDDSCCGDSESDSSTTCDATPRPRGPHAAPVQTRITDFWRTRRCSSSDAIVKANPGAQVVVPSTGTSVPV